MEDRVKGFGFRGERSQGHFGELVRKKKKHCHCGFCLSSCCHKIERPDRIAHWLSFKLNCDIALALLFGIFTLGFYRFCFANCDRIWSDKYSPLH